MLVLAISLKSAILLSLLVLLLLVLMRLCVAFCKTLPLLFANARDCDDAVDEPVKVPEFDSAGEYSMLSVSDEDAAVVDPIGDTEGDLESRVVDFVVIIEGISLVAVVASEAARCLSGASEASVLRAIM